MAVFKRYRGKRIAPSDPDWQKARWWMEFRLRGHYVLESVVGARTKAQAERAETQFEKKSMMAVTIRRLPPPSSAILSTNNPYLGPKAISFRMLTTRGAASC
jgi:hypothetical protein